MEFSRSAILAQLDFINGGSIPPLPSAPIIERLFLANPWPTVLAIVLLAVTLFLVLNARGKIKPALVTSGTLAVLAIVAFFVSTSTVTDRERIKMRTVELIEAVAQVDLVVLHAILHEDLTTHATRVPKNATKADVIELVERIIGQTYSVTNHKVLDLQSTIYGPRVGRTQTRVRVGSEFGEIPSWWQIDWTRQEDGTWLVSRIEALWIPGVPNPGG